MKKLFTLIIAATLALGCNAAQGKAAAAPKADIIAQADSAYTSDNFKGAVTLYGEAIRQLGPSANRLYNLGNAYFRDKQLGRAIVCYERALRLDPSNSDIKDNLEFVNSRITDRITSSESFLGKNFSAAASWMSSNAWAVTALAAFIAALLGVSLYFFAEAIVLRKLGFFGAGVLLLVSLGSIAMSLRAATLSSADNQAVVVTPSVILSTQPREPRDRSEEAFLLHDGAKVTILDAVKQPKADGKVEQWYDVKVDAAHRAWIPASAIEVI
jgi:tetratricopeptide (TPR) repeat protein